MPTGDDAPDGTEEEEVLPCGCPYMASLLEMWYVKKGIFLTEYLKEPNKLREELEALGLSVKHLGPKQFGESKILLLRAWELIFGPFKTDVLFNFRGRREEALMKFGWMEGQYIAYLEPNPGYPDVVRPRAVEREEGPERSCNCGSGERDSGVPRMPGGTYTMLICLILMLIQSQPLFQ
ncbi:hypothetical protein BS50DRAFT_589252 [Corynespora cassiicola Philippines]|uniref:Uncharacterized protein n=1 Tax=Corynespora cassiicola Philippines TaxID=1448308 RepID=A0A2T2NN91_CORCC|nr:hypothetical protein BS50DRAFT_589252 [Corynespora cassiicola Philippines]